MDAIFEGEPGVDNSAWSRPTSKSTWRHGDRLRSVPMCLVIEILLHLILFYLDSRSPCRYIRSDVGGINMMNYHCSLSLILFSVMLNWCVGVLLLYLTMHPAVGRLRRSNSQCRHSWSNSECRQGVLDKLQMQAENLGQIPNAGREFGTNPECRHYVAGQVNICTLATKLAPHHPHLR